MITKSGLEKIAETRIGEQVLRYNEAKKVYEMYTILEKSEKPGRLQKVYNIVAGGQLTDDERRNGDAKVAGTKFILIKGVRQMLYFFFYFIQDFFSLISLKTTICNGKKH